MCHRAAVIRSGAISAIEEIQVLLEKQMKKVRVVFATLPEDKTLPTGAQHPKWRSTKLSFEFVGPVDGLIAWLAKQDLHDAVMEEPDLESIFMNYYQQ
mgnify:FL=1